VETVESATVPACEVVAGPWWISSIREYVSAPLFRNAAYLWTSTIVLSAFGFVFWAAAARLYPADAVGYAASVIAVIALISGFASLGLGLGVIRFLPLRPDSRTTLVNSVLLLTAAVGLVASLVFLLGVDLWSRGLRFVRDDPVFSATFLLGTIAFSLSSVLDQVLVAMRTARLVLIKNLGLSFGRLMLVLFLAPFFASFGIVAAHGLAAAALVALSLLYLLPLASRGYRPAVQWAPREVWSIFPFSLGSYVSVLLLLAPSSLFAIIVLNTDGPESAAYFYVAWTIGQVAAAFATSLSLSLFAEGSHTPTELRRIALRALLGGSLVAFVAAVALAVMADPILHVFGSEYVSNGSGLLRILAISVVPYLVVNVYIAAERVQERVASPALVAGALAATSLVAGYVLNRIMGLEGIGVAWAAGQGAALVVIGAILGRRRAGTLGLHKTRLPRGSSF
jgi:O-antigen/teichoic acid export membrane protein